MIDNSVRKPRKKKEMKGTGYKRERKKERKKERKTLKPCTSDAYRLLQLKERKKERKKGKRSRVRNERDRQIDMSRRRKSRTTM